MGTPIRMNFVANFWASRKKPTIFSENNVVLFSGGPKICNEIHSDWRDPPPLFSENSLFLPAQNFRKNRNEIFRIGNDPPPIRKFSENSLILVQVMLPKVIKSLI